MAKGRTNSRLVYGTIAGLNLAVVLMFTAILYPHPPKVEYQAMAVSSARIVEPLKIREATVGVPNRISVPDVDIDVGVQTGSYSPESQSWTLDYGTAFYADRSVPANDSNGITLIYGHADWEVFARIIELREGAKATVYTNEGARFIYVYESTTQVEPTDTSVLNNGGPPKLVLQTCSGPFDMYRTLVTFRLVEVTKA